MKKLFIIFLFFILFISKVDASNITKFDYIDNVYYVIKLGDYYSSYNEPMIYIDNKPVYCLEPEKKALEGKEYEIGNNNSVNLTDEQLKKIELIGHYGYGYSNHTSNKYYLAAQELIWKVSRPNVQMYWSDKENGTNQISVEKEKEEIMNLVNQHNQIPSINNKVITLTTNQNIELNMEEFIKNYQIYDSGPHNVKIQDNKIIINTSDSYVGTYKIKLKRIIDKEKSQIYILNDYQSLMYTYNVDEKDFYFEIDTKVGSLTIQKIDSETLNTKPQGEASFSGTTFEIYDEKHNLLQNIVLNDNGFAKIDNLSLGTYYIKEIKSGKGYIICENEIKIILKDDNQLVTVKNDVVKSKIQIEKTYGDNYVLEAGAEFLIIDKFGNENIIKTDKEGKASIDLPYGKYSVKQIKGINNHYFIENFEIDINENTGKTINYKLHNEPIKTSIIINKLDKVTGEKILDSVSFKIYDVQNKKYLVNNNSDIFTTNIGVLKIDDLCLGKYIIEELSSPYGYLKNEKMEIELLEENINDKNEIEISYYNELILGKIEILKEGINYYDEKIKLDNVKFGIFAKDDIIINNKLYYKKDELVENIVTSNGITLSKYIPVGKYYIKELETVIGYKKDENLYDVEIKEKSTVRIKFTNHILKKKVTINKNGIDFKNNKIALDNVKFGVFSKEDIIIGNEKYFKKDELVEEIITINGQANSIYLPIGKYYVKELETIEGFQIEKNNYNFSIEKEDVILNINNKMILGRIKINKIGITDKEQVKLSNVKFGVFAKEDIIISNEKYYKKDELIKEFITNDGIYLLENIPIGKYYIKELETIDNYMLDQELHYFEIKDNKLNEITVYNYLKEDPFDVFEIPDTEIKTKKISKFSMCLLIFIGYIIIKYAKK